MFSTSDLAQGIGKLKKAGQIRVRNSNGSIQYEERSEDGSLVLAASSITENFFEGSVYFDLNHVNQTETWDCGLSCLSMIFSSSGKDQSDLLSVKQLHLNRHRTTVVWTVCLAYLAKFFSPDERDGVQFYTIHKDISANYKKDIDTLQQIPPSEEDFLKALETVQCLVKDSEVNNVQIFERELTEEEFKEKIIAGYVAVVLLNSLRFACLECQRNLYHSHDNVYHLSDIPTHLDESVGPPYRGHYVLVCGYNDKMETYLYKNPDSKQCVCFVPVKTFEHSRKSYGTQQNVVFIRLNELHYNRKK